MDFGRYDGEVVIPGDAELDGTVFLHFAFHRLTEGLGVVDQLEQFAELLRVLGEFGLFEEPFLAIEVHPFAGESYEGF